MELIVTNRSKLKNKYGADGWEKIHKSLESYLDALDQAGIDANLFLVETSDPKEIKYNIRTLHDKHSAKYLLFLGGDDIIPFYCCPDKTTDKALDKHVFSDSYYVDFNEDGYEHCPEIAVGRLPDAGNTEELLLEQIQRAVSIHRSGGIPLVEQHAGFSAQSWENTSSNMYSRIDNTCKNFYLSPPLSLETSDIINADYFPSPGGILFFNLHGDRSQAIWRGERRLLDFPIQHPKLVDYKLLSQISLTNSVIFCEACHASAIHNNRTPTNSLALCALKQGAAAFFGSTVKSYAVTLKNSEPSGASGIDMLFFELIYQLCRIPGTRFGDALQNAKKRYIINNAYDEKNVLGLVLLGDPMLCFKPT
ncbi:hypothetical protein NIES2101_02980 [Calothrix sp. HK-06]|nr:hypothetical protein NIES2101_02980 [Calothrix sp. HK-06]